MSTAFQPNAFENDAFQIASSPPPPPPPPTSAAHPFIVLPVAISFERWVAELQVDFSTEEIPLNYKEENWRDFADQLRRLSTFSNNQIPTHDGFSDWRQWAMRVVQTLGA